MRARGWHKDAEVDGASLLSDRELVARIRCGDGGAMNTLYLRYHPKLVDVCAPRVRGSQVLAGELAHEALVKAWQRLDQFSGSEFEAWVSTIARRLCVDHHRRAVREQAGLALGPMPGPADPVDEALARDEARLLRTAIEGLPVRQATALRLHLAGKSSVEAARSLGMEPNAVNQLLFRARASLRARLARLRCAVSGFPVVRQLRLWHLRSHEYVGALPIGELAIAGGLMLVGGLSSSPNGIDATTASPSAVMLPSSSPAAASAGLGISFAVETDLARPTEPSEHTFNVAEAGERPDPTPVADLGVVELYSGEQASDWAEEENAQQPIHHSVPGIVDVGLDPVQIVGDLLRHVPGAR